MVLRISVGFRSATLPRPLQVIALAGDLIVHCIRRQIDLTRRRDRSVIDEDLLEELLIPQWRDSGDPGAVVGLGRFQNADINRGFEFTISSENVA